MFLRTLIESKTKHPADITDTHISPLRIRESTRLSSTPCNHILTHRLVCAEGHQESRHKGMDKPINNITKCRCHRTLKQNAQIGENKRIPFIYLKTKGRSMMIYMMNQYSVARTDLDSTKLIRRLDVRFYRWAQLFSPSMGYFFSFCYLF